MSPLLKRNLTPTIYKNVNKNIYIYIPYILFNFNFSQNDISTIFTVLIA